MDTCLELLEIGSQGDHGTIHDRAQTEEGRRRLGDPRSRKRPRGGGSVEGSRAVPAPFQHEVAAADCLRLPFRNDAFDAIICVAVLHHLSTEARRLQALREMYRVVKGGGAILITVWAFEQPPSSKRQFQKQDNMVPWHLQRRFSGRSSTAAGTLDADRRECGSEVYQRFCHVFARDELPRLARTIEGLEVKCEMYDQGNWQIHLTKGRGQEALERAPTDTEAG
mmetsp:Transcript_9814/g.36967  ORF Transcript_9814/g.36967 Transcript_9814/m.36967 type:complete len:224 (-) Transcript_9814:2315-2986(-)